MDQAKAIDAFGALAQETRLTVFRLLVRAGDDGLTAGEIAAQLGVPPSTMSHHLSWLERAGLARSRRAHRQIFYSPNVEGVLSLLSFLMEDCCQGRAEILSSNSKGSSCEAPACAPGR